MAIHSPHTGIVDYSKVSQKYADDVKESGGDIYCNYEVNFNITSVTCC